MMHRCRFFIATLAVVALAACQHEAEPGSPGLSVSAPPPIAATPLTAD